jgi:zinc/manganese transport system ATP-binding protein
VSAARAGDVPALRLRDAALAFGERRLWSGLDLDVAPGEFVAVLGANGAGKTSLLKVVLGQRPLSAGTIEIAGRPVRRGGRDIGYVPQQRGLEPTTPLRARDFVRLGLDGHRWGPLLPNRRADAAVDRGRAACGSRRASWATQRCCCATSRCCPWTCTTPRP